MRRRILFCTLATLAVACTGNTGGTGGDAPGEAPRPGPAAPEARRPSLRAPEDLPIQPMPGNRITALQSTGAPDAAAFVVDFESPGDWVGTAAHYEAELLQRGFELERSEAEIDGRRTLTLEGRRARDGVETRLSLRQEGAGPILVHFRWIPAHVEE